MKALEYIAHVLTMSAAGCAGMLYIVDEGCRRATSYARDIGFNGTPEI